MALDGRLFRVTNLRAFLPAFLVNGQPTQGFEASFARAHVRLIVHVAGSPSDQSDFLGMPSFPISPSLSLATEADDDGEFSIKVPDELQQSRGHLVIHQEAGVITIPGILGSPPTTIRLFEPIYRTGDFLLRSVDGVQQRVYVSLQRTADAQGVDQAAINTTLAEFQTTLELDSLRGSIRDNGIDCRARKDDGAVDFEIKIRPGTTHELDSLVSVKAEDIVLDLPGPDFIVGLCVNEADIRRPLRRAVRRLSQPFSARILAGVAEAAGDAGAILASAASLTVTRVRFPVTGTQSVPFSPAGPLTVPRRSIVPDIAVGFPRGLSSNPN